MDLLTAIRQNSQQATQNQGVTDETQKAQDLLSARTGKDQGSSGVKTTTNLGEKQAVAQTNQQLGLLAQGAAAQNQGLAQAQESQQNQFNQQSQAIGQERQGLQLRNSLQTNEILNNLKRSKGDIDQKQYEAQMDQVAQDVRLQTKSYVDNLQREAGKARLNDKFSFEEQLVKDQFGDSGKLLQKQLGNKSILDASDREFEEATAKMGINESYAAFKRELQGQKQAAMWSSIGALTNAGIGAASTYSQGQAANAETNRKIDYYNSEEGQLETGYDANKYRNMEKIE
jgi:hypothetical protein